MQTFIPIAGLADVVAGGSSRRIKRVILLTEPASIDANEITNKGYINQSATLDRRADQVEALYAEPPGPDVIMIAE